MLKNSAKVNFGMQGRCHRQSVVARMNWPRRSLFVIQAEPSDIPARQLAIQLFDRGSADLVLLGTDWATHLDKLIQIDASLTKADQLVLILPSGAAVPKVDFQGAVGVVTSSDLKDLIARLDFPVLACNHSHKYGTTPKRQGHH